MHTLYEKSSQVLYPIVLAGIFALGAAAFAQSVTTGATGFFKVTIPAGQATAMTPLLESAEVDRGTLSAVDVSILTDSTKSWTAGAFARVEVPYIVQLITGASAGRHFLITANTTTTATVQTNGLNLTALVALGDVYRIVPVDTLGTLFGTSSVPFQTGASAASADNVLIWDTSGSWLTYFNNGTAWKRSGSLAIQNDTPLLPDTALYIIRRGATDLTFQLTGNVPLVGPMFALKPAGSTFVGNPQPADFTLANSGFKDSPSWLQGASAASADIVLFWDGTAWLTFYYNGANWKRSGALNNQDAYVVAAGTPFYVIRRSAPVAASSYVKTPLVYTP